MLTKCLTALKLQINLFSLMKNGTSVLKMEKVDSRDVHILLFKILIRSKSVSLNPKPNLKLGKHKVQILINPKSKKLIMKILALNSIIFLLF